MVWSIPWVPRILNRKIFWYGLPMKKVRFSYGNVQLFRINKFKNRSFSSGKQVVQSEPNPVWRIPWVPKVYNRKKFWYGLPRKKVRISIGNIDFFAYYSLFFLKNIELRRVKELTKLNQIWYGVSHGYLECKTERIFGIACLEKDFVFQSEISTFSLILFPKI